MDIILSRFKSAYHAGRLAHAYLLDGDPRGSAGELAKKILCLLFCESDEERPCGSCPACRRVMSGNMPDVVWVQPENKSRLIVVSQISKIQDYMSKTSFGGGWKTVVISCAERMNAESANKFLKILEEPPGKSMFLLLSAAPGKMLSTVVSRCQRIRVPDAGENAEYDRIIADVMSDQSGVGYIGGMKKALMLCELLAKWKSEAADSATVKVDNDEDSDEKEGSAANLKVESEYKEMRANLLRSLETWHMDVLRCVSCETGDEHLRFSEHAAQIKKTAGRLTFRQAVDNIKIVEEMSYQLDMYFSEQSVFERGFGKMSL